MAALPLPALRFPPASAKEVWYSPEGHPSHRRRTDAEAAAAALAASVQAAAAFEAAEAVYNYPCSPTECGDWLTDIDPFYSPTADDDVPRKRRAAASAAAAAIRAGAAKRGRSGANP